MISPAMPDLVQILVMFAAFLAYLIFSGWSRHRQQQRKKPWWGQGR